MFTPAIRATCAIPFSCGSVVPDPFFTTEARWYEYLRTLADQVIPYFGNSPPHGLILARDRADYWLLLYASRAVS